MFKRNDKYEVNLRIGKCDYMRFSPAQTSTMNTAKSQIYINIPQEDSVISLLNSYLDLNIEVIKKAGNSRYAIGNDIRLVKLGPIALFSIFKLRTSCGKNLEGFGHAHLVSSNCKLIISAEDTDNLSICFDWDRRRRRDEVTNNDKIREKYHLRIMLKEVFGFAKPQEKATYGLGKELTLTRGIDDANLDKAVGDADARIKTVYIQWCVPHYATSIPQRAIVFEKFLSKTPTELRYIGRSVSMKEVINQNLWNFKLGSQKSMNGPIRIAIGF